MLVVVVGALRVYLAPDVKELFFEGRPEFRTLGRLELPGAEGNPRAATRSLLGTLE
jgi:hypothetical protein